MADASQATAGAQAAVERRDDDVVGVGDFFVCRDYVPVTYNFGEAGTQTLECLNAAATDFDLTGQIVWQIARLTAWYIAHVRAELAGKDVLELGAGAGLCGMLASRWARSVALTDNEDEVLSLLERNVKYCSPTCAVHVCNVSWGVAEDHARLRAVSGVERFPVIIGADVVYWSSSVLPLVESVKALLHPEGVFILGYFDRVARTGRHLLEALHAGGFDVRTVPHTDYLPSPMPEEFQDHVHNMTLYRITWAHAREAP